MTQTEIYNFFEEKISKSAIQKIDDEWQVVGKWCRVSFDDDGTIDLWICNTADMYAGLPRQKHTWLMKALKSAHEGDYHDLDGESWVKVQDKNVILNNLDLLGIRRKRRVSDKQRKLLAERLKDVRVRAE